MQYHPFLRTMVSACPVNRHMLGNECIIFNIGEPVASDI
jgi:hypothetical protein